MTARLYIGDVHDRTTEPEPLDCGHPDDGHLWHHDHDGRQVCAGCCPTCHPEPTDVA